MFTFIPSQYPDDGSIVPHQRNYVQVCEVIFRLAQFWSRLYEMLCKEGIFPVAGLKVTDSTWQIIKCSFSSIFVQIPKIWPDLKFQITNIGQQGGQLVQLSDVLCLILNQNILHLVKFCLNNGPETKKRAIHMNIFVLTFLGRYQYQGFTLILGAVKRNWIISRLCFERSWPLELSRQMSSGKLLT